MRKYKSVTFSNVKITGAFWRERLETVLAHTIPSQHKQLRSHGILDSLKLPQPVPPLHIPLNDHNFTTQIFWDSDVGKWIEAASYALSHRRDATIEAQIEAIIDDLESAQAGDGYLNCWYLEREPENRWTNLRDNHELYNAGHLLEGAVAYFHATGRTRFMAIMQRYMDHIAARFGSSPDKLPGYPGHQEIELALIKLFHATSIQKYLDLATYFVNQRGKQPHYFDTERTVRGENPEAFVQTTYEYNQSHLPVREQTKVVGHAVRAMYMYAAMADLAAEHGDKGLRLACETLWQDVTQTRMYLTGGFGPSADNEGFTRDYDLPNDTAYAETCASVAMVFWAARMLNLDLDGQYADILELALFNTGLAGLSQDGEHYFYDNKLESDGSHQRWEWHPCPCCTMNVARMVASVAGYFYSAAENEVAVHLYGGSETTLAVAGGRVTLTETSNYPWSGNINIEVNPEGCSAFTLALRIPGWAKGVTVKVNGTEIDAASLISGYLKIDRQWAASDTVTLSLEMPIERIYAHPDVRQDAGKVALRRGPLVYCMEQHDNAEAIHRIKLPECVTLSAEWRPELLGGIYVIKSQALASATETWGTSLYRTTSPTERPCVLTAVPYFIWCNRGSVPMQVWIRE